MNHRSHSILEAVSASPTLHALQLRSELGSSRMRLLERLLPKALCTQLRSGNCDEADWCILSPSSGIAAKLRQWIPEIEAQLLAQEHRAIQVRVKVTHT